VAEEWGEVTGKAIYQALGQSEISTYISSCPSRPPKKGTVGVAQPGRSVVTLAEQAGEEPLPAGEAGLLAVHRTDPGLMLGYWRRPEEERDMFRGPWFLGGDAAVIDEEGYVTHLGRHNELMNAGGFRVSPLEVEEQLARHPAVAEVAAAEVTVRDGVSIIAAFVVTKDGSAVDPAALAQFASERLASYKCPREYRFVTSLPRTANGKVKRRTLCL
jgi:acyl-coenzyme A synthetase/AMP-(fatty) acid ligase